MHPWHSSKQYLHQHSLDTLTITQSLLLSSLQGNGALECVNCTCPSIDYCPEELRYTPEGVCCPTCKVPVCNAQQEERAMNVTVDNGCRECSCKVSEEV